MSSTINRALISVYDKTGIVDFARTLTGEFGIEILSTGGTAKLLKESDIPVTLVEDVTGSGEMLDGRVKTLHPNIHAGILADRDNPDHMRQLEEAGIKPIDMVVVNLYPFEDTIAKPDCTFEEAIEMIDIGGPCMLRAAAKNHQHVVPVFNRHAYEPLLRVLRGGSCEKLSKLRRRYSRTAFLVTWRYDREVAAYLERGSIADGNGAPAAQGLFKLPALHRTETLRYGENPHQSAELRAIDAERQSSPEEEPAIAFGCDEERMSFNNYVDADSALALCKELNWGWRGADSSSRSRSTGPLPRYGCSFIKHTNACGCSVDDDANEAYRKAYLGDPNAAMGGILAVNFPVDAAFATSVMETYDRWGKKAGAGGFFLEVWIAPDFEDTALDTIRSRKKWGERVRLVTVGEMSGPPDCSRTDLKKVSGGILFQTRDGVGLDDNNWTVVTKRTPTDGEMADLRLAWLVCKHTKSNAISVCKDGMLIGNGAGQMSRVMSCRIATWLAKENGHEESLAGAVAASDAFFPFRDGPDILIDAGVRAIIQPGGSKRDDDTIAACDERDVAMVFTGTRHFKH